MIRINSVLDSSISKIGSNPSNTLAKPSGSIHMGVIRGQIDDALPFSLIYIVEAVIGGQKVMIRCRQLSKFGDPFNYEEWSLREDSLKSGARITFGFTSRVGEVVIVAPLDGKYAEGVIIGAIKHPSRAHKLNPKKDGLSYISEFNGLETTIDKYGAYKIKFKGAAKNSDAINKLNGEPSIPEPEYNTDIGGAYFSFQKDGSYELTDGNSKLPQSLKIDKPNGKFTITSGDVSIDIDKNSKKISVSCEQYQVDASKILKLSSKSDIQLNAIKTIKIDAAKIAIGHGNVELIDTVLKLIDAFGTLIVNSPMGPCSPLKSAPTWAQILALKNKLSVIKGSL